jgi:uncharacterized protein (TIGR03067 family)
MPRVLSPFPESGLERQIRFAGDFDAAATNVKHKNCPHGCIFLCVLTPCLWGALVLTTGARTAAQIANVAGDYKQLQGVWRVRSVISRSISAFGSDSFVLIEGDKLGSFFPLPELPEYTFTLNPNKNPKQIDLMPVLRQFNSPAQKAAPPAETRVFGIYELEMDRLKLRVGQVGKAARPADFTMVRAGPEEFSLILERVNSPETQRKVKEDITVQKIRNSGVKTFIETNEGGGKTLCVQFNSEQGDPLLAEIVPYLKWLNMATDLHVDGTGVTDRGVAMLDGVDCFRLVDLEGTSVSDAGISRLQKLAHLNFLIVSDTRVTAAGVDRLRQSLPTLKVTNLTRAQSVSLKAIREVGGVLSWDSDQRVLQVLFTNLNLNDAKLHRLQEHLDVWKSSLRVIDLTNCPITDDGLKWLANLTALKQLNLSGTDVTVAGVKALKRTLPNLKVRH